MSSRSKIRSIFRNRSAKLVNDLLRQEKAAYPSVGFTAAGAVHTKAQLGVPDGNGYGILHRTCGVSAFAGIISPLKPPAR